MADSIDVKALTKRGADLEEIAQAFGVERRDGELLRSWSRRIDMAIYREEFEYKLLRDHVDVHFEYRRDKEREASARKKAGSGEMLL